MFGTWLCTVRRDSHSAVAMSGLDRPTATRSAIFNSVAVSAAQPVVPGGREHGQVPAELGQQHVCGVEGHAGDGAYQVDQVRDRRDHRVDLLVEYGELVVEAHQHASDRTEGLCTEHRQSGPDNGEVSHFDLK
jgi:hypothetical protein